MAGKPTVEQAERWARAYVRVPGSAAEYLPILLAEYDHLRAENAALKAARGRVLAECDRVEKQFPPESNWMQMSTDTVRALLAVEEGE